MTLLDRYLARAVIGGTLLVLLVLLSLAGFINLIGQLDNIGTGDYQLADAVVYVLLSLPLNMFDMMPVSALLGSLLGLGALASHSELIVARAAGVSIWRLARSAAIAGLVLLLIAAAVGEFIAPPAEQYSERYRAIAMHKDLGLSEGSSGWIKDGRIILNVDRLEGEDQAGGIYIFGLGDDQNLTSIATATSASVDAGQRWALEDYRETRLADDRLEAVVARQYVRETGVSPAVLSLSVIEPESLPARGMLRYVRYLQRNGLDPDRYEVALWSRLGLTASVAVMAVLGLPFVFGSLRSVGAGQRMLVGVLLGAGFFIGSRTLASSGTVYGLHPVVTGLLPVMALTALTAIGLVRAR